MLIPNAPVLTDCFLCVSMLRNLFLRFMLFSCLFLEGSLHFMQYLSNLELPPLTEGSFLCIMFSYIYTMMVSIACLMHVVVANAFFVT